MAERAIWDKLREVQSFLEDINSRLVTLEAWVGKAFFTLPERIPLRSSRWVLEIFPEEIEEWVRAVKTIPLEPLTERERSFLRSLEYYITTERKITLPQLLWLAAIQRRAGGIMPKIPIPPAESSHHSSPVVQGGAPKTDIERLMAHYGLSREEAERLVEGVMRFYGVSKEEAIKALLPPRGAKVRGSQEWSSPNQLYICEQCGTTYSAPQEACPVCYGKVEAIE